MPFMILICCMDVTMPLNTTVFSDTSHTILHNAFYISDYAITLINYKPSTNNNYKSD